MASNHAHAALRSAARTDLRVATREAVTLPFVFLTVVALASFRASPATGAFGFEPPALVFLVLAVLVLAVLVRSGALSPAALMHADRSPLDNLSGAVVMATLFGATAQLLAALTPRAGLLHLVFVVFFAVLFWNTLAMRPDPTRAHRSLLLVLGTAFLLDHIVLAALYDTRASFAKKVVTALLEGVSLGSLEDEPTASITGYVVFAAGILYFVGLVLLPQDRASASAQPVSSMSLEPRS